MVKLIKGINSTANIHNWSDSFYLEIVCTKLQSTPLVIGTKKGYF